MDPDIEVLLHATDIHTLMTNAFHITHRMHALDARAEKERIADLRAQRDLIVAEITRRVSREVDTEDLARDLCDTYYLTVNPRPEWMMQFAYDKISETTRVHWRAQAALLLEKGWTR